MVTTMTEKKFYTQEDLLVAISKLPEKEAENILENFKLNTVLTFINYCSEAHREQWKNDFLESIRKELCVYNGFTKLYNMLPVIDSTIYEQENVERYNSRPSRLGFLKFFEFS